MHKVAIYIMKDKDSVIYDVNHTDIQLETCAANLDMLISGLKQDHHRGHW